MAPMREPGAGQHETPRQVARQHALDDRLHQRRLRRRKFLRAELVGRARAACTVAATAQHANAAPINWPSCCRAGVAPTSQPVFRSCEMSPALDAATATIVPTVSTAARASGVTQPAAANTRRRAEQRHERDARGRLRRDADDADDARGHGDEQHAEDPDAAPRAPRAAAAPMSPAKTPGTRPATSTTVATPPNTKDAGQVAIRARRPSRGACRRSPRMPRATARERADHRRQAAQHGEDAGRRHRAGADVAHVARPDVARLHVARRAATVSG